MSQPEGPTFETALAAIEEIVEHLERGEPSLTAALAQYEKGVALLRQCYQLLERAERSVALLTGVDDQGEAVTSPFDGSATFDQPPTNALEGPGGAPRPGRPRRAARKPGRDGAADDGETAPPF